MSKLEDGYAKILRKNKIKFEYIISGETKYRANDAGKLGTYARIEYVNDKGETEVFYE